jgi:hypothetical protein
MLVAREKHGADAGFHGRFQGSKQQSEDKRTSLMGHRARLHICERRRKSQRPPGEGLNLYERRKNPIVSEILAWSKPIATQGPSLEEIERVSSGEMSSSSVENSVGTYEIMDTVRVSLGENGNIYTSHNVSHCESSERGPKRPPKYLRCRSHRLSSASCMVDGSNAARRTRCP